MRYSEYLDWKEAGSIGFEKSLLLFLFMLVKTSGPGLIKPFGALGFGDLPAAPSFLLFLLPDYLFITYEFFNTFFSSFLFGGDL